MAVVEVEVEEAEEEMNNRIFKDVQEIGSVSLVKIQIFRGVMIAINAMRLGLMEIQREEALAVGEIGIVIAEGLEEMMVVDMEVTDHTDEMTGKAVAQ